MEMLRYLSTRLVLTCLVSVFSGLPLQPVPAPFNIPLAGPENTDLCPPLAAPTGNIVNVSTVSALENAVNTASSGDTILIAAGTYNLNGVYLRIETPNVTLRSQNGQRDAVILDGNYITTEIIQIVASNVTIADLTLRRAVDHPLHIMTNGSTVANPLVYNVHIVDPGEQAIKINPSGAGYLDDGIIACSHIELTAAGRPHVESSPPCYTGGIDGHYARRWEIRDNLIEGFWCPAGLAEHGIHLWVNSSETVVERNRLFNNARGIGFGLGSSGHTGGVIRNNMVHVRQDVGIGLESSPDTRVLNNTVYTENYFNSIEYRFAATARVEIINNLTNQAIAGRDGGSGTVQNNVSSAQPGWFANATTGNLHLVADSIPGVVDQAQPLAGVTDDFDGSRRPIGSAADIGADEYGLPPPAAVTDLRVTHAMTAAGILTAALRWTPPANALTTTLRYSNSPITTGNWSSAPLLTDTLSGSVDIFTATVTYSGGTGYFALKTEGSGGKSGLSNAAFWPALEVYLPVIIK